MGAEQDHRGATRNRLADVEVLAIAGAMAVRVFDVSEGGLALITASPLGPGEALEVHVGGENPVRLLVRYCELLPERSSATGQRYRVGTRFADPASGPDRLSDLLERHHNLSVYAATEEAAAPELPPTSGDERRRAPRHPVANLTAQANGRPVQVQDVSSEGMSLITAAPLLPGEAFSLAFPGHEPLQLVVRHCEPQRSAGTAEPHYRVGARIVMPDPDHPLFATALDAFVNTLVAARDT